MHCRPEIRGNPVINCLPLSRRQQPLSYVDLSDTRLPLFGANEGKVDHLVTVRDLPAFRLSRLQTELDRLPDVCQGLLACPPLRDTTGDNRTFGEDPTVFTRTQEDREIHDLNFTLSAPAMPPSAPGLGFHRLSMGPLPVDDQPAAADPLSTWVSILLGNQTLFS